MSIACRSNMEEQLCLADDYIVTFGHVHSLPHRLRSQSVQQAIAQFSDLVYEDRLIARVLHKPFSTPFQLFKHICQDPLINVTLVIISLDLQSPSTARDVLDETVANLSEFKASPSFSNFAVVVLACNCRSFLDSVTGFAADMMSGVLRRRALHLDASLFYSEDANDYESAIFYIERILHPSRFHVRSNVRQPSLTDSYLTIPSGLDTQDLVAKLHSSEDKFHDIFPVSEEPYRSPVELVAALDDREFMEVLREKLENLDTSCDVRTPVAQRRHSSDMIMYQSPSAANATCIPSATSQIAVKSFFESLLAPGLKDDRMEQGILHRNAKEALHDMSNS